MALTRVPQHSVKCGIAFCRGHFRQAEMAQVGRDRRIPGRSLALLAAGFGNRPRWAGGVPWKYANRPALVMPWSFANCGPPNRVGKDTLENLNLTRNPRSWLTRNPIYWILSLL
jgi:hypothetical protein